MTLKELILAVKEKKLTREQLEAYRDELANLSALMHLELSDIEKEEALYRADSKETSDIATTRKWQVTKSGQRQIELKHFIKATDKMVSSCKNRLYDQYYNN